MPDVTGDHQYQLLCQLKKAGAVLIPVHRDKSPLHKRWSRRQTRVRRCLLHLQAGGLLAVIPASIDRTVIDVDRGDPTELIQCHPPDAATPTPSGGQHLWYRDSTPRAPRTWQARGCSGDIISARSYVVLWEGVEGLARIMDTPSSGTSYPADMIKRAPRAEPGTATPRPPLDHSPEAQARRGRLSGISRGRVPRIRAMVAKGMVRNGHTQNHIATVLGVTTRTVRSYLGYDVPPAGDWERGLQEIQKLERIERTCRRRLPRAAERAEANLVGGRGGPGPSPTQSGSAPAGEVIQTEVRQHPGQSGAQDYPGCGVHHPGYTHWTPPAVRAVQLALYRLRAEANIGIESKQYQLVNRTAQRYLRGTARRSCPARAEAVEKQANAIAAAADEAVANGYPFVDVMTAIIERRYRDVEKLQDRYAGLQPDSHLPSDESRVAVSSMILIADLVTPESSDAPPVERYYSVFAQTASRLRIASRQGMMTRARFIYPAHLTHFRSRATAEIIRASLDSGGSRKLLGGIGGIGYRFSETWRH